MNEADMTEEEFEKLYKKALERLRSDPEKKKMLDDFDTAIRELMIREPFEKKAG